MEQKVKMEDVNATGYDVSALNDYLDENRLPLYGKAFLTGKTVDVVAHQSGVKGKAAINVLDVDVTFQDGANCGFTPVGADKFTQREIETKLIKLEKQYCWKDLLSKWTSAQVKNAIQAGDKELDFGEYIFGKITDGVKAKVESLLWNGDDELGINGFLSYSEEFTPAESTGDDAQTKILDVYNAIPAEILDKAVIFVGSDIFRSYVQELVKSNYYHYNPDAPKDEVVIPGTTTKVIAVNGLNGTGTIVGADPDNLIYGYDVPEGVNYIDGWYERKDDTYDVRIQANIGTQVAIPSEVVILTGSSAEEA